MIGNVLVLGNSGVGKSTLINAVLGADVAQAKFGTEGTTSELKVYQSEELPFRLIDTVGFEPTRNFLEPLFGSAPIRAVQDWCRKSMREDNTAERISMIWFCVDGTSSKLFGQTLADFINATNVFKSIPIIVVITKSYSLCDQEKNLRMVEDALSKHKNVRDRVREIIPVVAQVFQITEETGVPVKGVNELRDATISLIPEAVSYAEEDVHRYNLERKRMFSYSITGLAVTSATIVGAVPIPIADAVILGPIETAEVNGIARIYGIRKGEEAKSLLDTIINVGTVSVTAKVAISALKAIPGINLATAPLNAAIAGMIAGAIGMASTQVFEQIHLGKLKTTDVIGVRKIVEDYFSKEFVGKATEVLKNTTTENAQLDFGKLVISIFEKK